MLASLDDLKTFLPGDKFQVTDGNTELDLVQVDVERLIKGYLSSVFQATTLAAWADPTTTPSYIRSIAGRLVAAFYYAKRLSEDLPDWDKTYPQRIYDEAMMMLEMVRSGQVVLEGVTDTPGTEFDSSFFYPDSNARAAAFTMGMKW